LIKKKIIKNNKMRLAKGKLASSFFLIQ